MIKRNRQLVSSIIVVEAGVEDYRRLISLPRLVVNFIVVACLTPANGCPLRANQLLIKVALLQSSFSSTSDLIAELLIAIYLKGHTNGDCRVPGSQKD